MTYHFKFAYFIAFALLLCCLTACQHETKQLPVQKVTHQAWQKKAKEQKKLAYEGPHNFFEFNHRIRTRSGDTRPRYTTNYKQTALQKALRQRKEIGSPRNNLDWQERGPGNVGGRTRGVLVDKRDTTHLTWLIGSAGGGIWKTTDGGENYELKTAGIANLSATTLAASEVNPDVIYAGTGEGLSLIHI